MPISPIVLQRRHAELGRIRLGNQVPTNNGKTRPNKLDKFRFTSASEQHVRDLAALYGGEAKAWDNNGKAEWEVFTTAQSLPVIVVKGGLSQWMEYWSGGGCVHRCDGVTNHLTGQPCDQDTTMVTIKGEQFRAHDVAKPYTRLSVMLPELEAIGVWRMESHGWNAAAEIPAIAELAQFVGDLVPAVLHLMERRTVKDGQTSRFVVPVLDLRIGTERLKEIVAEKSGTPAALSAGSAPALSSGSTPALGSSVPDYLAQAQDASAFETVVAIRGKAETEGHLTPELDAQLKVVADSLRQAAAQVPDADGAIDADVVDPEGAAAAADMAWQQVLAVAGRAGFSLDETKGEYAEWSQGLSADDATAEQLDAFREYFAAGHDVKASA